MTYRTRDAVMITAIVGVLLFALIAVAFLIQEGASNANGLPLTLAPQPAPAETVVAPVAPEQHVAGNPLRASSAWVSRTSAASGVPWTAVEAYGDATLRLSREQPSCHLGWTTLAGIGTVESANGTIGGRELYPNGLSSAPITGPALNGAGGYAAIANGNGGWTTALGPMQFIPSTWQMWGADATGAGVADINNIFDAALAAGRYLCADGHDLSTAQGWTAAVYSYNHSANYVQEVYAAANAAAG